MDKIFLTDDDDRRTPSTEKSSSDSTSSVSTVNLLPVDDNDQEQITNRGRVCVRRVKVDDHSLPNLNIKHPCRPDDESDPFNDEKQIIIDEHVKVSHIKRSNLRRLYTDNLLLRLDICSRRKSTANVSVSRTNKRISQCMSGNLNHRKTRPVTSNESTVHVSRLPTAVSINQRPKQKIIASKPMVTRVPFSNELPIKMKEKELHASIKSAPVHSKKSS